MNPIFTVKYAYQRKEEKMTCYTIYNVIATLNYKKFSAAVLG